MASGERAWSAGGRSRATVVGAVVLVCAALVGVLMGRSSATSASGASGLPSADVVTVPPPPTSSVSSAPDSPDRLPNEEQHRLGVSDGIVPRGVTVFDGGYPAVGNLDAGLLGALRRAARDASRDEVTLYVESGWRSPKYQEQLVRQAVARYGSEAEAARWVAPPDRSAHVSGDAVDLGQRDGPAWLAKHGARYGLCRIYRNEPWHFELRPDAAIHGCPPTYADAAHDPRMQP